MTGDPQLLADGSEPASADVLLGRLADLEIEVHTVEHVPVFTVAEAKRVRGDLAGGQTKNLFLRDKRGAMWLVCCPEDRAIDLKALAPRLGVKRLSFGSRERLMKYLGVGPGAVSPFAVINDHGCKVRVVLDRDVLTHEPINLHPLDNEKTTAISAAGLLAFLEAEGHVAEVMDV
jgi:Ala-tRNA(Pro) deacylase